MTKQTKRARGSWSKPYYGVQHYQVHGAGARPQFSITNYGTFVTAYVLGLEGFTAIRETTCDTVDEARAWIEAQAAILLPS